MKYIIDNLLHKKNHFSIIKSLISKSTELLFASPFLMDDFNKFFREQDLNMINSIYLLTTLKPNDPDQIIKVKSFSSLKTCINTKNDNIKLKIFINNSLHGKIYLFKKKNECFSGIVTSANLTDNGLCNNYEWGIKIDDAPILKKLESDVFNNSKNRAVSQDDIRRFQSMVSRYQQTKKSIANRKIDLVLLAPEDRLSNDINYWLKPIGSTEFPTKNGQKFNNTIETLDFSKRRPSGVQIGDIIIAYGIGNGRILSVYEVITAPKYATKTEIKKETWKKRWPWSVKGKNLSKMYGSEWWKHDLFLTGLYKEYTKLNPTNKITKAGGKTLGAINYHIDKVNLSYDFAEYIIMNVMTLNK